nr:MAG TPA: cuticle protein [Siphoviridae sp. ct8LQ5]
MSREGAFFELNKTIRQFDGDPSVSPNYPKCAC